MIHAPGFLKRYGASARGGPAITLKTCYER